MSNRLHKWLLAVFLCSIVLHCTSDEDHTESEQKNEFPEQKNDPKKEEPKEDKYISYLVKTYEFFKHQYLWLQEIPKLDASRYTDGKTLVSDIRYKNHDRWSYFMGPIDKSSYEANISTYWPAAFMTTSYGDSLVVVIGTAIWNRAYQNTLSKGMEVYSYNGKKVRVSTKDYLKDKQNNSITDFYRTVSSKSNISTIQAELRTYEDYTTNTYKTSNVSISRESYAKDPIPTHWVKSFGSMKLGYIKLTTFSGKDIGYHIVKQLDEICRSFIGQGVNTLIVDLKNNPGGKARVSSIFANMLIPDAQKKQYISYRIYGDNTHKNQVTPNGVFTFGNGLFYDMKSSPVLGNQLNRIYFFTDKRTASASETLLNYVTPYINHTLIGTKTSGKMVGGPVIGFADEKEVMQYFYIITSRSVNADGNTRYTPWTPEPTNLYIDRGRYSDSDINHPFIQKVLSLENKKIFAKEVNDVPYIDLDLPNNLNDFDFTPLDVIFNP